MVTLLKPRVADIAEDKLPHIIYYVASSLDGYIATTDGSVEWLSDFQEPGEDYGYSRFYASIDAMLLGSHTYQQILTFGEWPYPGKPCGVLSRRQLHLNLPEVTLYDTTPCQVASELATQGHKRVWLVGGGTLAASFRAQGLITEYIISIVPIILGAGIPLFASGGAKQNLNQVSTQSFQSGIVQLQYLRV